MSLERGMATLALALLFVHAFEAHSQEPIGILLAAGDIARCGDELEKAKATAAILAGQVKDADAKNMPVHVLALGDLAYDQGTAAEFDNCFDTSWGTLLKLQLAHSDVASLMLPVPGNHEYESASAKPYFDYFDKKKNPWVFQQEKEQKKQKTNKGYYALKFPDPAAGPWHLFGLNSMLGNQAMKEQTKWLDQELKASDPQLTPSRPPCVLAFWHHPLFSSGTHGHGDCYKVKGKPCQKRGAPLCRPDQEAPFCERTKKMREAYRLLYSQGASVILAGHDHDFEQFKRLNPDAKPDPAKGIRSFVVGTGGAELYREPRDHRWNEEQHVQDVYRHSSYGVLRVELFSDRYRWSFLPIEGDPPIPLEVHGAVVDNDRCVPRS